MKKLFALIMVCAMVLSLAACSGSSAPAKKLDMAAFAADVLENVKYDDEMIELSEKVVDKYYDLEIEGLEGYVIYVSGSAATTNELAVFECSSSAAVDACKAEVEERLESQRTAYESYRPDEIYRLDNAVVKSSGNYLLFSVSGDNDAVEKLFDSALG